MRVGCPTRVDKGKERRDKGKEMREKREEGGSYVPYEHVNT